MASVGLLRPGSTVFFLCDIQERFAGLIQYWPSVIGVAQRMLAGGRALNVPIVATEQNPSKLGKTVPELDLGGVSVFAKTRFSMCTPDVDKFLDQNTPKSVVLFGIEAHVCVQQTALDLRSRGYDVHVVADGTSSRFSTDRMTAFDRMRQSGVFVSTSESILFQLMVDSQHPSFKAVSSIVKNNLPDSGLLRVRTEMEPEAKL